MELTNVFIEPTPKTPQVDFNHITGELILAGKSIPENPAKIYDDLLKWTHEYVKNPRQTTNLRLNIEYFNTASVIWVAKIVKALCTIDDQDRSLFIHLYFDIEEFDSMETEDVKEALGPVMDVVGTPNINLGIKLYGTNANGEILKETLVLI
jgi:hypothetical protein